MKIQTGIRKAISSEIVKKWEVITGNNQNTANHNDFLSSTLNGKPKSNEDEIIPSWTIRDCILNNEHVREYITTTLSFRGKTPIERIEKYNGYKFYQNIYLTNNDECSQIYLDTYAIFLGFKNFKNYVTESTTILEDDRIIQLEIIDTEERNEDKVRDIEKIKRAKRDYNIPLHFGGYFSGYFIRPRKPDVNLQLFSKMTLLITDTGTVYVRTTDSEKNDQFDTMHYEGFCYSTNNFSTMHVEFMVVNQDNKAFEFMFIFDTETRKIKNVFIDYKILRGVYAGSDAGTNRPAAGRLIIKQEKSWQDLIAKHQLKSEVIKNFLSLPQYAPHDIKNSIINLLEKKENSKNVIRDFFTVEERYFEDVSIIRKYARSYIKYNSIEGNYSIYTLSSAGTEIRRGIANISRYGEVNIKGSKGTDEELRKFHGWATILKNDVLSIIVNREKNGQETENDETISYLLKLNDTPDEDKSKILNGVRIMTTFDGEHTPFAGRVAFVRENEGFYKKNNELKSIKLFEDIQSRKQNRQNLEKFKALYKGALYNLLVGFENNLIKTFGTKRERVGFARNINYKENFFLLAKYYASKKNKEDYEMTAINLYYSHLHGQENLYQKMQNDKEKDFEHFMKDPYFKRVIKIGVENYIIFNDLEIDRIKLRLPEMNYTYQDE